MHKLHVYNCTAEPGETMTSKNMTEVERLMSPSCFSKRLGPDEIITNHVEFISKVSNENKSTVDCTLGIRYGPQEAQQIDFFGGKKIPNDAPIFVYVHGGYWQELSRETSSYCVLPLVQSGIRVAVVGYDLAPSVSLKTIVQEIQEAAKFVLKYAAECGAKHVAFGGHSAGAHLCAELLVPQFLSTVDQAYVGLLKGVILISGVYDLRPLVDTYVNDALRFDLKMAEEMSPLLWSKDVLSKAAGLGVQGVVTCGEIESPEFIRQSTEFHKLLKCAGILSEFMMISEVDHFNVVERLADNSYELTQTIICFMKS